ncbi:MAG: HDOD domain-containing protein [Phycisphaerales bacterium]
MASALFDKVLTCPSLPSLPAVAVEVLKVTRNPNVRLPDIARIVQNDPGLSAKILKTVNSSLFGLKERCTRIDRALGFMGMNAVKSIVLGISLVDGTKGVKGEAGFDPNEFWRKTIYGAAAARYLAQVTCVADPDEAFTAGLFQDIGVLAAVTALKDTYIRAVAAAEDPSALCEVEREKLGFDHTEVGGELTTRWCLPQKYIDCIRFHHSAPAYTGDHTDIVRLVALGGFVADACGGGKLASKQMARFRLYAEKWFPGVFDNAEQVLNATGAAAKELARLFEKNVGDPPDTAAIMAEVQERSVEHQLAMQQEAERLRQSNQALAEQNFTDQLTGIGNRRRFDNVISEAIRDADAATPVRPISLLFIDADKFKSVNDTYGHPAGDAVLVELARRFREAVGESGLVCRFGGEEFAALLPDCDTAAAAQVAEKARSIVAAKPFDLSRVPGAPEELKVTISVGVATRQPPGQGPLAGASVEKLLKAADEAVYAAKQGGRNCVRVSGADRRSSNPDPLGNPAAAGPIAAGQVPAKGGAHVMVVDDDPLAATLLKACLQRQGRVDVSMHSTTAEALELLKQMGKRGFGPGAMILDFQTAGRGGLEFVREVRALPFTACVPIFVTGTKPDAAFRENCLAAGVTDVVSKSDLARDLTKWVTRIVHEAGVGASARAA